jgi:hypothetical protein
MSNLEYRHIVLRIYKLQVKETNKLRKTFGVFLSIFLLFTLVPMVHAESVVNYAVEPQFDDVTGFQEGLAFVKVGDKWGVIDKTGKEVVKPQYDDPEYFAYSFIEGMAQVSKDGKWGYIDKTGKEIVSPQYELFGGDFSDGLAAIFVDGQFGYINKSGDEVIEPQFDEASDFSEGLAVVRDSDTGYISFIDKTGKKVIETPYYYQYDVIPGYDLFNEGLLWVFNEDSKYGAIDKTGKVIVDLIYDEPTYQLDGGEYGNRSYYFSEGLAIVGEDLNRVIIDTTGKEVAKLQQYDGSEYFYVSDYIDGLATIRTGDYTMYKWGFIDKEGKEVIKAQYDHAKDFSEGLAAIRKSHKWGFVNNAGQEVITPQYDDAYSFQEGLAWVKTGEKWGAIDKTGKEVIKPQYDDWFVGSDIAYAFTEGFAFVRQGDNFGYIDKTGKEVTGLQFENAWYFNEGRAPVQVGEKWGYITNPLTTSATPPSVNGNDIPAQWAKAEVDAAISLNLVPEDMQNGYAQNITRAEFSSLAINLLTVKTGKSIDEMLAEADKEIDNTVFNDTTDETVLAAYAFGIVTGKSNGTFDPNGNITRQEAAVMLARTAKLFNINSSSTGTEFADKGNIASWANEAVAFVSSVEDKTNNAFIMGGTGNNNFSPNASYTRQQAYITMKRLFNAE